MQNDSHDELAGKPPRASDRTSRCLSIWYGIRGQKLDLLQFLGGYDVEGIWSRLTQRTHGTREGPVTTSLKCRLGLIRTRSALRYRSFVSAIS